MAQIGLLKDLLLGRVPDRGPDFFIAGATRSGTTYLHHLLGVHPDVFMPGTKELHYFDNDRRYREDLSGYRRRFHGYRGERLIGEATPSYMMHEWKAHRNGVAMARIGRHFPDAKIIISLRDPLTRAVSQYEKNFLQGRVTAGIADELAAEDRGSSRLRLIYQNSYDIHIASVFDHFPQEAVRFLVFEEWTKAVPETAASLAEFLGLRPLANWPVPEKKAQNDRNRYRRVSEVPPALDDASRDKIVAGTAAGRRFVEALLGRKMPWAC